MTEGANTSLKIDGLSAGYSSRKIIRDLSLPPVLAGRVTALVGPNGAGKTTLLRSLAGLLPSTGQVSLDRDDLLAMLAPARARLMAFMPQFMPPRMPLSVLESVISAIRASPVDTDPMAAADVRDRAVAMLDRLGIVHLALHPFDNLSGGQRQLTSLAQALVREPRLLLLDEPLSALDLRHQIQVMDVIRAVAQSGTIVIAVLHDLSLAARWAGSMIVMRRGELYAAGSSSETLNTVMLRDVYGVDAVVEKTSGGGLHIQASRIFDSDVARP